MDFSQTRDGAAREIALAFGVPPLLLGLPGDNTYSNFQEANRAFWRQTAIPLVGRLQKSFAAWLTPAYGTLRFDANLDHIGALAEERTLEWRRIGEAGFLTLDEQRAAAGYGPAPQGFAAKGSDALELRYSPDQPRAPAGSTDGGRWVAEGGGGGSGGGSGNFGVAWLNDTPPRAARTNPPAEGLEPILHLRLFNPFDDYYGLAPLAAAQLALDTHNAASFWNKALLDNSARPSGALVYARPDGAHLTDEQFTRLKEELEENFSGALNAGRPLLLEGGLDWKALSLSPKDMDFSQTRDGAAQQTARRASPKAHHVRHFKRHSGARRSRASGAFSMGLRRLNAGPYRSARDE